jgi:FO synthase
MADDARKLVDDYRRGSVSLDTLLACSRARRDSHWGGVLTYSPKVFLPLTNLCRNVCDYCAFRRSPSEEGAWTMTPDEVETSLEEARQVGAVEALFCLGDRPESGFSSYRRQLASWGFSSTVDYLVWAAQRALEWGLLPHTNAGVLGAEAMGRLREVNVSLGLMLENTSERLCAPGMPHHRAPDKRPELRIEMTAAAGRLGIAFTSGLLIGIGETRDERIATLLAISELHRQYGHIQEVIVQNFQPHPNTLMSSAAPATIREMQETVSLARLLLDDEISVQSPPNLNAGAIEVLIDAGVNDFGGISAVTPDYINPRYPWPHVDALSERCRRMGFVLKPRLAVYDGFAGEDRFLTPDLRRAVDSSRSRLVTSAGQPDRSALF